MNGHQARHGFVAAFRRILALPVCVPAQLVGVPVRAGRASLHVPLSTPLSTGLFRVQCLFLDRPGWIASHAVTIELP